MKVKCHSSGQGVFIKILCRRVAARCSGLIKPLQISEIKKPSCAKHLWRSIGYSSGTWSIVAVSGSRWNKMSILYLKSERSNSFM
ncbi:hypothetical protein F2Q70_00030426 [Brassica cretica]|uniref:Uncharacterized protein n=1 Tax=Brassica cretica TaxID=69181 RepID=A0A8S9FK40_BRACR|nr:hypothetical protein F2Q70_00030426 [Brassica cretica]